MDRFEFHKLEAQRSCWSGLVGIYGKWIPSKVLKQNNSSVHSCHARIQSPMPRQIALNLYTRYQSAIDGTITTLLWARYHFQES
jgi:hypothetical protein